MLPEKTQQSHGRGRGETTFASHGVGAAGVERLATTGGAPHSSSPERPRLHEALRELPVALVEAVTEGVRLYVPAAVGGGLAFSGAALTHYVFGLQDWISALSFAAATGLICGRRLPARRRGSQ